MLNIAHRYPLCLVFVVFDYCVGMQCFACHQMNARHNYFFTWSWQSTEVQQEGLQTTHLGSLSCKSSAPASFLVIQGHNV